MRSHKTKLILFSSLLLGVGAAMMPRTGTAQTGGQQLHSIQTPGNSNSQSRNQGSWNIDQGNRGFTSNGAQNRGNGQRRDGNTRWDNKNTNSSNLFKVEDRDRNKDGDRDRNGDRDRDRDDRDKDRHSGDRDDHERNNRRGNEYNSVPYLDFGIPYSFGYSAAPNGAFNGDPSDAGYADGFDAGQFDRSQGNLYNPRQYERSGNPDYFEGFVSGYQDGFRR